MTRGKDFEILGFEEHTHGNMGGKTLSSVSVTVALRGQQEPISANASSEDGPVHAFDLALRKLLEPHFPCLKDVSLANYRVQIKHTIAGTASSVAAHITFGDKKAFFTTSVISTNVLVASFRAIAESFQRAISKESNHP